MALHSSLVRKVIKVISGWGLNIPKPTEKNYFKPRKMNLILHMRFSILSLVFLLVLKEVKLFSPKVYLLMNVNVSVSLIFGAQPEIYIMMN